MIGMMLSLALAGQAQVVDRIAAVVHDDVIALSDVYDIADGFVEQRCPAGEVSCVRSVELEVLDSLVRRALVKRELGKLDLAVTAADVDQAIDRTVREYNLEDRAALRAEVEKAGKGWQEYREELKQFLRTQAFQGRVLAPRVSVSEDELRDLYQRTARREKKLMVALDAFGVVVPEEATPELQAEMLGQTQALVTAVNEGTVSWEDAVRDYDGANLSPAMSGQMFKRGQLAPLVEELAFTGPLDVAQPPVQVGPVLFVVKVQKREESLGDVVAFEDAKEQLQNQVFTKKLGEAEEEWYQRARREASIRVLLKP